MELANQFVLDLEYDWFYALMIEAEGLEHIAQGCGCRNCRMSAERAKQVEEDEANRMSYGSDHEEPPKRTYAKKRR